MTAVDTNVLVRLLTRDDPSQWPAAERVMRSPRVFVSTTVLLETARVLQACHRLPAAVIRRALLGIAGLPNVVLEAPTVVAGAMSLAESGVDLADAFHLVAAADAREFVTFDRRLAKAAARIPGAPCVKVPSAAR